MAYGQILSKSRDLEATYAPAKVAGQTSDPHRNHMPDNLLKRQYIIRDLDVP